MQPGKGVCVKEIDNMVPGQLVALANQSEDKNPGLVADVICNWNDGNNDTFKYKSRSKEANRFRASKRGKWIRNLPSFNEN